MKNTKNLLKGLAMKILVILTATSPMTANACYEYCSNCGAAVSYYSYDTVDRSSNYFTADTYSYVIPDSGSRYLTRDELSSYSGLYLMLARNEIYAKHGYMFNDQNIQRYFNYKDWYYGYVPSQNFSDAVFNEYEAYNISQIVAEENSRGGAVQSIRWDN